MSNYYEYAYLSHHLYLVTCNQCRIFAGFDIYNKIENELFHIIISYIAYKDFIFDTKHDFIKFSKDGKSASIGGRFMRHCHAIFGPVLNTSYMTKYGLKYYCKFIAKQGNIAVGMVPENWKVINTHFNKIYDSKISFIYQNGWCRGAEIYGGSGSNQYKQINNTFFMPTGTSAIVSIDLSEFKMSVTNHIGHQIYVSLWKMNNYHLTFEMGNCPAQIVVIDQWWRKCKPKNRNTVLRTFLPLNLFFHYANK
eukprot:428401_1